ncbi:D-alanyl-D-alanine carboxypeptidase [Streptomyces cadmiisoli]|uniref:D-alanyl-D-alanine carboxypeptidase n=1 Tax=Streptomyces cadmiisoli TaxID=2184053 RepID=A0A2Z4J7T7_9ACTN|nr:D-alanyl-D-alanine carboxypeptidase [Streptomyces cadmiisoli]
MKIGLSSRAAVSTCGFCLAGVLALAPVAAAAPTGADPGTPGGPHAAIPPPALLHRSGTQVRPRAGAPAVPDVTALSWLVADARTGEVLAGHNAHRQLPPASTLKTLFALTVLPVLPGGTRHRVTHDELKGVGSGSSLVGVSEGHAYTVTDLWHGVFLSSGNDAARVLAELNGGWLTTAARMEAKARLLGAHDTHVRSPDGYDAEGQVSSAYDLAVFGRAGLRSTDFSRYCRTVEAEFPGENGWPYPIRNTNRLLSGDDGVEPYRGVIGIKNGYTSNAGHTLVAAARRDGRTLVVTVMNPQSDGPFDVYEEARSLLDWGFAAAGRVEPVGSLDALRSSARPGPDVPLAAAEPVAPGPRPGWPETAAIAAAACLGAGAVALALRLKGERSAAG